jgi:Flp pilus assembly protein TadD
VRRNAALWPLAVALLAALPSLRPGFIHDDHRIIEQNQLVQDPVRLPEILARGYWTVDDRQVPNLYRPVTILSFALNRLATGPAPAGFRAVDLLLHVLVTGLVFGVARRMTGPGTAQPAAVAAGAVPGAALAAALLFAAHPVHTEALGLVVGRSEILMALFTLASIALFLDGRRGWALALVPLAIFSKESGIAAPFLLIAADRLRHGRTRFSIPFAAAATGVAIACLIVRSAVLGGIIPAAFTHFIDNPIAHLSFPGSLFTALAALARYALLLVWPRHLSIDYSYASIPQASSLADPRVLCGMLVVAGVAAGMARAWTRRPAVAFSLLLFALPLLPVSNLLFPIGTILAERLLYLPSAGACLLTGIAVAPWIEERGPAPRRLALAGIAILAALLALRGLGRFRDWQDDRSIFAAAIRLYPDNVRAQFNYGAASERARDDAAAESAYRRAVSVWPQFSDAQYNLAGVLGRSGRWREATEAYRAALTEQPGNVTYLVNAGHAAAQAGDLRAARDLLERAVALDPTSEPGWTDLGAVRLQSGDAPGALAAWSESARLKPGRPDVMANLAMAHEAAGHRDEAAEAWSAAATGKPEDPILRYRLGRALEAAGKPDDAAAAYRESIRLAPGSPVPLKALGLLLAARGHTDEARDWLTRARTLDPSGQVMDEAAMRVLRGLGGAPAARAPSPAPPSPSDHPGRN